MKRYLPLLCIPCIITARPVPKKLPSPQPTSTASSPASFELSQPYSVIYNPTFSPPAILTPHEHYLEDSLEATHHSNRDRSPTPYEIPYTHANRTPRTDSSPLSPHFVYDSNAYTPSPKKCVTPVDANSLSIVDHHMFHALLLKNLKKMNGASSQKPVDQWIENIKKLHQKDPNNTYICEKWQKLAALKSRLSYKAPRPSQQRYFHPEVFNIPWRP